MAIWDWECWLGVALWLLGLWLWVFPAMFSSGQSPIANKSHWPRFFILECCPNYAEEFAEFSGRPRWLRFLRRCWAWFYLTFVF
jgi:hypothetical protein